MLSSPKGSLCWRWEKHFGLVRRSSGQISPNPGDWETRRQEPGGAAGERSRAPMESGQFLRPGGRRRHHNSITSFPKPGLNRVRSWGGNPRHVNVFGEIRTGGNSSRQEGAKKNQKPKNPRRGGEKNNNQEGD